MHTVNIDTIQAVPLPKRTIRVLVGSGSPLSSTRMTFGVTTVPAGETMDPHSHGAEEEIIYILSGHGYVDIDGAREPLRAGTVIKLPVKSAHYICNESPGEMTFVFCFNPPVQVGAYDKS